LINLVAPSGGWNAQYCRGASCSSIPSSQITVSGPALNQTLTFNLTDSSYNIAGNGISNVTFDAVLGVPAGVTGTTARFQNCFVAGYNSSLTTGNICMPPAAVLYRVEYTDNP
jgi:hypothetical protein